MRKRKTLLPLLFVTLCNSAGADTLLLKDGQKIEGRYLSSTDTSVQFEVNGKPFTYTIWLIREIDFQPSTSPAAPQPAPYTGPRGKEQQDRFCSVLSDFVRARNKTASEPNPIRRAEMHSPDPWSFEDSVARVFGPNGEFVDWTGRLFFSVSGSDVVLTFEPTCGAGSSVTFTNGYPADPRNSAHAARIPLSSPLAQKLREGRPNGMYQVSGHLFLRNSSVNFHSLGPSGSSSADSRQHFESAQPNGAANVTNPQYLVQFTEVTPFGH